MTAAPAALELVGVHKHFGAIEALAGVSLSVTRGSVHALLGENGAGKSTAMRLVAGLLRPDAGTIRIGGRSFSSLGPAESIALGVGMVHQHFMLVGSLTVTENVILGAEPHRGPLVDRRAAEARVQALAAEHGLEVDPRACIEDLSVAERQRVEILKTLHRGARILILDEPTAVLAPKEARSLLASMKRLAAGGATVVFVTHKLDEVIEVAERATVLRRGRSEGDVSVPGSSAAELARAMVGRPVVLGVAPARTVALADGAPIALELEKVTLRQRGRARPPLAGVSLRVRAGEVVGVAGVDGNGQRELAWVIAGMVAPSAGTVRIGGEDVTALGTADRFARGLGHVPEDRQRHGLVLGLSLWENLALGRLAEDAPRGVLREKEMRARAARLLERHDVRPRDPDLPASALSGGNQQKLVVARELGRRAHGGKGAPEDAPRVLVAAQPTRGVDVGAIEEIWTRLAAARDAGCGVLLVSAELSELLALSDRIVVLVRGAIAASFTRAEATAELLGAAMLGAAAPAESLHA